MNIIDAANSKESWVSIQDDEDVRKYYKNRLKKSQKKLDLPAYVW